MIEYNQPNDSPGRLVNLFRSHGLLTTTDGKPIAHHQAPLGLNLVTLLRRAQIKKNIDVESMVRGVGM